MYLCLERLDAELRRSRWAGAGKNSLSKPPLHRPTPRWTVPPFGVVNLALVLQHRHQLTFRQIDIAALALPPLEILFDLNLQSGSVEHAARWRHFLLLLDAISGF
jgi:hypothetical protein